jgi:integrase
LSSLSVRRSPLLSTSLGWIEGWIAMARTVNRLTDRTVRALKAPGFHHDGGGLYLQVSPSGAKSWVFRFKINGRRRDMGLGKADVGDRIGITLAQARQESTRARRLRIEEKDPIEARNSERASQRLIEARSTTFRECAEQLIASHEVGWRNAKHRQQWRNTLISYAYPVLGGVPVADVGTDLVLKVLQPIWKAKTETASRVRGRMEAVLSWAKARGMRTGENPAQWRGHLDQLLPARSKVHRVTHHAALPYTDVPAFMARLWARDGITPRALELTILTAVRTNEAIGARFDEFDLTGKVWRIPAERMKAGQEHRVPLCDRAVTIIREMAATRLNDFVFPGIKRGQHLSDMAMLVMLRELQRGITVHGFRSSFRDWAGEETAHPHDICEAALAHTRKDKAHAAYQRGDLLAKRRKLMDAWGRFCEPQLKAPPKAVKKAAKHSSAKTSN